MTGTHREGLQAKAADIIAAARRYAESGELKPGYIPHLSTWLNDGRWEDDYTIGSRKPAWWENPEMVARCGADRWKAGIAKDANGHWPIDKLGPVPGTPDCKVPENIVSELRLTERYDQYGMERSAWKTKTKA